MIFLVIVISLFVALYFYSTRTFDYWEKRGVKYKKPVVLFGTNADVFLMKKSTVQACDEIYRKYPEEKVVGCFRFTTPELLLRDPELVKKVLATDFNYFRDRSIVPLAQTNDPLIRHIFAVDGDLWKMLRQRLTPAFTSGKLKAMFPLIVERAERLHTRIETVMDKPIDARDLMARFTTDFIGACAFGLDMDCLSENNSKFRELGKNIATLEIKDAIRLLFKNIFPVIFKNVNIVKKEVTESVMFLVKTVLEQRNYEPSGRNDFIDLLLECKKKGSMVGDSIEKFNVDGSPEKVSYEMTDELMAAQAFVFFAAGFETSSSTSSFTLHLLAYNPEKQKKVHEEIDRVLALHDNKLSYDAIKEMTYLEGAFKESMRILPSVGFLFRTCVRKYTFEDINLTIDKGVKVMIPVQAMQMDPKYFENPEQFRPERFDSKTSSEITKFAYLPFGEGPRACIGERLGLMQAVAGLAAVLSKFSVEPAPTSVRHPKVDATPSVVQTIKKGLPLLFKERKKTQ